MKERKTIAILSLIVLAQMVFLKIPFDVVICFQIVFFDRLHTEYPRAILSITDSYNENYKEKKCGNLSVKAPA